MRMQDHQVALNQFLFHFFPYRFQLSWECPVSRQPAILQKTGSFFPARDISPVYKELDYITICNSMTLSIMQTRGEGEDRHAVF